MVKNARITRYIADYVGMALVLVVLCAFFAWKTDSFLTVKTFTLLANQFAYAIVLAAAMTFVLIIAGIDLSVGSVLALSSAVLGVCLEDYGLPLPFAIAACLATGLLCGAMNGFVVVRWNIPSFIVTLGMLEAARGATYLVTDSDTKHLPENILVVADTTLFGLGLPFYIAITIVILGQITLTRTAYGRHILAIGANEEAARLSGINTRLLKLSVFVLSGLLAGVAGLIFTARFGAAAPNTGIGFELQAIAAVVIGGTSLMGGRGSVVSSFFGVSIIAVLAHGLTLTSTGDPTKRLITGAVIVLAVIIDYYRHRLRKTAK